MSAKSTKSTKVHFLVGIDFNENYNRTTDIQRLVESYESIEYNFNNELVFAIPENVAIPSNLDLRNYKIFRFKQNKEVIEYSVYINVIYGLNQYMDTVFELDSVVVLEPDMIFLENNVIDITSDKIQMLHLSLDDLDESDRDDLDIYQSKKMFKSVLDLDVKYYTIGSGMIIPVKLKNHFKELEIEEEKHLLKFKSIYKRMFFETFSIEEVLFNRLIENNLVDTNPYVIQI